MSESTMAAEVREVLAAMREHGAHRLKYGNLEIEMGPKVIRIEGKPEAPPSPPAPHPAPPALVDLEPQPPRVCSCGHEWAEHTDVGCGHGCDMASCGVPAEAPAPEGAGS